MPIDEDEWDAGRQLDELDRNIIRIVEQAWPRALSVAEVVGLITEASADELEDIEFRLMSAAEPRQIESKLATLAEGGVFERKEIVTGDGSMTYYRWADGAEDEAELTD